MGSATTICSDKTGTLTLNQDVLLCGVYVRREAVFENTDHARKVFDMALSSSEAVNPVLGSILL